MPTPNLKVSYSLREHIAFKDFLEIFGLKILFVLLLFSSLLPWCASTDLFREDFSDVKKDEKMKNEKSQTSAKV